MKPGQMIMVIFIEKMETRVLQEPPVGSKPIVLAGTCQIPGFLYTIPEPRVSNPSPGAL